MNTFCIVLLFSVGMAQQEARVMEDINIKSFEAGMEFLLTIDEWLESRDPGEPQGYGIGLCGSDEIKYSRNHLFRGRLPTLEANQQPQFVGLQMTENRHLKEFGPRNRQAGAGVEFEYPPLQRGDIIPIYGAICRVTNVEYVGLGVPNQRAERMSLRILKDKELPAGVRHPLLQHAIPFGAIIPVPHTRPMFRLLGYISPSATESEPAVRAELMVHGRKEAILLERLVVGDVIQLPPNSFRKHVVTPRWVIRGIVPPDKKANVIGWILLEAEQFVETTPADALAPRNPR